jgi:AbrB family looped-hinge helix DNA binding protein
MSVRITSKGQVTIPQEVREETGLLPDTEVEFVVENGGVRIVKAAARGAPGAARSRAASGARGRAMTTDEIMALTRDT